VKGLPEDILDHKTYGKLKLVKMEGSGHFIAEEKPADTIAAIEAFLD
jgi:pimeloyl-ACP methyl ester carboxylesterase